MQENNSTMSATTAVLLRETELPIILHNGDAKNDANAKDDFVRIGVTHDSRTAKGHAQGEA
jgi:hypothetical protein